MARVPDSPRAGTPGLTTGWAAKTYADCPLVEIVHLHDCIRGELVRLLDGITRLRIDTSEATRTGGVYGVDQEVQIRSQVQMLYAVFQAHSTAEDEIIWPALKAKQFAGGQDGTFVGKEGELVRELDYVEDHEDEERVSHYPQPL